jgi:hypothetical protein
MRFSTVRNDIITIERVDPDQPDSRSAIESLARAAALSLVPDDVTAAVSDAVYGYLA